LQSAFTTHRPARHIAIGCDKLIDSHVETKQFISGHSGTVSFFDTPSHEQQSLTKVQSASSWHSGAGAAVVPPEPPSPPNPPTPPVPLELPLPPIPLEFDEEELEDDDDGPVVSVLTSGPHPVKTAKDTSVK